MKHSIRTRFALGIVFLFVIILVLAVFSGYYLNKLSDKTSAILRENFFSVVYAREMSAGIMKIDQEIYKGYLAGRDPDSLKILNELGVIGKSLQSEKNNITEPGEDKLVSDIAAGYNEYHNALINYIKSPDKAAEVLSLQNKSAILYQQLLLLSEINEKALELKTDDAKASSRKALTQMTGLASLCFLIGLTFTFSFATYFNQRFYQLYSGIKEIVSSNYDQRLFFYGNDEFHEISLLLNEMAEKLKNNKQEMSVTLQENRLKDISSSDVEELKKIALRIKSIEEQTMALISKFEIKQN